VQGCKDAISLSQLKASAEELSIGLQGLLGEKAYTVSVMTDKPAPAGTKLVLNVLGGTSLGLEGFRILRDSGIVHVEAGTSSGLLYGVFSLLSLIQQHKAIPENFESVPAMELRVWDLWDNVDGTVEQGFSGQSLLWPYALLADDKPPPRNQLFLRACNASDVWQKWDIPGLAAVPQHSMIINMASKECLSRELAQNPMQTTANRSACTSWTFSPNGTISVGGECMDVQNGEGPDIDWSACKHLPTSDDPDERAYVRKQMFEYDRKTQQIRTMPEIKSPVDGGQCLSAERTWPAGPGLDPFDSNGPGGYRKRFTHMLRAIKSAGFNSIALLNVNACIRGNLMTLETEALKNISANLGPILEEWGIKPYWSVCYAAPFLLGGISSDPSNPATQRWWSSKFQEIHKLFPTFGGVLVKADCEGNQGPQSFNKTEADGANLLARALKPIKDTVVLWRAFIYGGSTKMAHEEKAKQEYDTMHPLDGKFDDNVILQIKHTPMDFLIRDPVHPLLAGGLTETPMVMEVYTGGCDTGQQIHAVALTPQWKHYLDFDIDLNSTTIGSILSGKQPKYRGKGMACISNFGRWRNVTGHVLAASSAYGCGRLSWDPTADPTVIHSEWAAMTFASEVVSAADRTKVVSTVTSILDQSWGTYEGYTSPLGIGWMCAGCASYAGDDAPGTGFGCAPKTVGPGPGPDGAQCPLSTNRDHLQNPDGSFGHPGGLENGHQHWHYNIDPCANYDTQNMSRFGLGCNRVSTGTNFVSRYLPAVAALYNNLSTCPVELLLFFHNVPWSHPVLLDGVKVPLIDYISNRSHQALNQAKHQAGNWNSLRGLVDTARLEAVQARFKQQNVDALSFNKAIVGYYTNISQGRE
jgi:alpha-glucuronidase